MKKICIIFIGILISLSFAPLSYADTVVYNTKTHKIHSPNCRWADKCTVNCIKIKRKEAVKQGGVPCKVCNGGK